MSRPIKLGVLHRVMSSLSGGYAQAINVPRMDSSRHNASRHATSYRVTCCVIQGAAGLQNRCIPRRATGLQCVVLIVGWGMTSWRTATAGAGIIRPSR
ncbi:hypothetical protein B0J12DRAFT_642359 [Macrophomina phaseolina]|uniref:Uncharacterized protein n=1 Tax=Macrophomina phaseolina TaxID=35725 RepID=A0ABQ8GVA0_9PEZI|nr:hypothetical protein B0J12DRAFT_642359 [Macrophomina phaseolina]